MKTIVITKDIYQFDELDEDARQNALESLCDINTDYEWYDFVIEDCVEKLKKEGFEDAKIFFSGFDTQGDGASFDASVELSQKVLDKFYNSLTGPLASAVKRHTKWFNSYLTECCWVRVLSNNSRSYHVRAKYFEGDTECSTAVPGRLEECFEELVDYLEELRKDLSYDIFFALRTEYDYLTSEKAIIETIKANEYEFNAKGSLI